MIEVKKAEELLNDMGIPADTEGYKYLLEAIELMQTQSGEE